MKPPLPSKSRLEQLAICGGPPAFGEPLHVGRPNIGDRDRLLARIQEMLDARWLTNRGRFVQELEERIAALVGVQHCIVVCNATIGLELVIRAVGLRGEVIVPSFTFVATAHALQWQEVTPVFCDLDPATHNLDPARVERLITPHTSGIIGVHVWGRPCAVEELAALAGRHKLELLFDAAHAFGCAHQGRMIGGFGRAEVFSFHATKFINTFEGGAIVTNDDELATKIRLMKNFGFAGYDNVIYIGTNGKMSEVSAAMGLTSLESMAEFIAVNRGNYETYHSLLAGLPGISLVEFDGHSQNNYQYIVLEVDAAKAGLERDQLMQVLHAENVLARRYFHPGCHRMEPYRSLFPDAGRQLPETERLTERVLVLPNGTAVGSAEIQTICDLIRVALANDGPLRERCQASRTPSA